jgi:hypothetical protein
MRIDNEDEQTGEEAEAVTDDVTEATSSNVLTTKQSDAVDMLRGRINSALIGFDADSRLTILETVRAVLNQMIDDVITELVGDDEAEAEADDETVTATCPECDRVFDLSDSDDASEWLYGHDCEV